MRPAKLLMVILLLALAAGHGAAGAQGQTSPYTPEPFTAITGGEGSPVVYGVHGDWVVYQPQDFGGGKAYKARNLVTNATYTADVSYVSGQRPVTIWEDEMVWIDGYGPSRIERYDLGSGEREVLVETANAILSVDYSGEVVVWLEYSSSQTRGQIRARDIGADLDYDIALGPEYKVMPRISGDLIVWAQAAVAGQQRDVYGHRLSDGKTFTISANPWDEYDPVVWGDIVVWADERNGSRSNTDVYAKDLTDGEEFAICTAAGMQRAPAIWDTLVVWEDGRELDGISSTDIYGYDLGKQAEFAITRHIGRQVAPAIYETTVVWQDWRNAPQVKYATADMYGARLAAKPATAPLPVTGKPSGFDALIQVVWPHSGQPGTDTDRVNIGVYLFSPQGSKREVACSYDPPVQLWVAENNQPARLVAQVNHRSWNWSPSVWHFNDVDVRAARGGDRRLYFFLATTEEGGFATNVWAHAADARTYFPQQVPVASALAKPPEAVDAVIQIVWPHDNKPVAEATRVNITANVFAAGTSASVPASWEPVVRLYRSLNNGLSEVVATGKKRLVTEGSLIYPVWDFNDIDVSQARDPLSKYYFRLVVEGAETHSNVWAHGADARTYFPEADRPECLCNACGAQP